MNQFRNMMYMARIVRRRNLNYRQLMAVWRGRGVFLQIFRNYRELEGSWTKGIIKFTDVYSASPRKR